MAISIHAPTRGATQWKHLITKCVSHFNPRSHEGSDVGSTDKGQVFDLFQSTLPRGERLVEQARRKANTMEISIHAPTRGATAPPDFVIVDIEAFQSTLPRGERPHQQMEQGEFVRFQSTLPRGERRNQ